MARKLHRSVRRPLLTVSDFMSYAAQGKIPPRAQQDNAELLCQWGGLSVFTTYAAARKNAALYRWRMGECIAELEIPDDASIVYEDPDHKGHLSLYGVHAAFLMSCATRVVHGPSVEALVPPRSGRVEAAALPAPGPAPPQRAPGTPGAARLPDRTDTPPADRRAAPQCRCAGPSPVSPPASGQARYAV